MWPLHTQGPLGFEGNPAERSSLHYRGIVQEREGSSRLTASGINNNAAGNEAFHLWFEQRV